MLWLWLSYRFEEESFPGRERAERTAAAFCELLDKGLERVTRACKRGVDVSLEVRGACHRPPWASTRSHPTPQFRSILPDVYAAFCEPGGNSFLASSGWFVC